MKKNIFGMSNTAINLNILDKVVFDESQVAVDWFMFKKYARNRKFQTFKKTLNNDKEQTIHKVKIHHSPR